MPDIGTSVPRPGIAVPKPGTREASLGTYVPIFAVTVPKVGTSMPKSGTRVPSLGTPLPKFGTRVPRLGTAVPIVQAYAGIFATHARRDGKHFLGIASRGLQSASDRPRFQISGRCHMLRERLIPLIAAIALGLIPTIASADIPNADDPKSFTNHDFLKATLEYNRRTMVEAYKQVGKRDPKWDADAIAVLEGIAWRFTNSRENETYHMTDEPDPKKLLAQAEVAQASGCDDPMVTYCHAVLLNDYGRNKEALPLTVKSSKEIMKSRYPVARALFAALRTYRNAEDPTERAEALGKFHDCFLALIVRNDWVGIERRILFKQINGSVDDLPLAEWTKLIDAAHELPNADPWLLATIEGHYHVTMAWEARGSGWADSVTQDGWKKFSEELGKARDCLTAAWKLHPDYPEPAARMITVAMGGGAELHENPRDWFDRAAKAQIDYDPAYSAYVNAILPRWGGSFPMMHQFALECLATGRYETDVPSMYAYICQQIANDTQGPGNQFWAQPGVFENFRAMAEGYLKQNPKRSNYYPTLAAAVGWRASQFEDAAKILDGLNGEPALYAFERVHALPKLAISHCYAMATGKSAATVTKAERQATTNLDEAIATYSAAAKEAGKNKSAHFFNSRLKQLEWEKQFQGGDWVDITPGPELYGWEGIAGEWKTDADGSVVGKASAWGHMLTFQGIFMPPRFEVEATFDFPESKEPLIGGFSLYPNDPLQFQGWSVHAAGDQSFIDNDYAPGHNVNVSITPGKHVIRMRSFDDKLKIDLDEQSCPRMFGMDRVFVGPRLYFAIGGKGNGVSTELRVSKIRVRMLKDEPPKD